MNLIVDPEFKECIPPLSDGERAGLESDILEAGVVRVPLDVWGKIIVDGHNRYEIATKHNIPFTVNQIEFESKAHAKIWIRTNQLHRRNLSDGWQAELVLQNKVDLIAIGRGKQAHGQTAPGKTLLSFNDKSVDTPHNTREVIASELGWSTGKVAQADYVKQHNPDLWEKAKDGNETIGGAYKKARQATARQRKPEPAITPPLPDGKYRCIVIDPPWPMKKIEREERPNQGIELDYPVMTLDDIAALPVKDLADENGCHLYLWVTQKYLPAGLELVKQWGFNYQCLMTWRKNVGMTPYSWMYDTEHVIFARRGNLKLTQLGLRLSFEAPVNGHSVKPDIFFNERVISASPEPRLEMFARLKREGFNVWGNEI